MNRLTQITYPDSTTVQFAYDYRGRRTSVTDQNGKVTTYAYDDADRLTSVTDAQTPTHGVTSYTYDGESNLTDIYDAASNHTHFTYFSDNTFFKTTFPSGQYETYIWDGTSQNLQYKTDRKGQQIIYWLDYQNRLFKKFYPDGSTVNYTYDDAQPRSQLSKP